jgi:hypothetical protein
MSPEVVRNAIRSSLRRRIRSGGQSGAGSSVEINTGNQYSRIRFPPGVPACTEVRMLLLSFGSIEASSLVS